MKRWPGSITVIRHRKVITWIVVLALPPIIAYLYLLTGVGGTFWGMGYLAACGVGGAVLRTRWSPFFIATAAVAGCWLLLAIRWYVIFDASAREAAGTDELLISAAIPLSIFFLGGSAAAAAYLGSKIGAARSSRRELSS